MTAALVLAPSALAVLERARAASAELAPIAHMLPLETPEQEQRAGHLLRALETLDREADEERTKAKAPHLKAGRDVDDAFRAPRAEVQRIAGLIRKRIGERALQRERDRLAALEAVRTAPVEQANLILASDPVFAPVEAVAGVAEVWSYEAVAFELRAMPLEYLAVDMVKIRAEIAAAKRAGRKPEVAGVTFERAVSHTVRRL